MLLAKHAEGHDADALRRFPDRRHPGGFATENASTCLLIVALKISLRIRRFQMKLFDPKVPSKPSIGTTSSNV